MNDNEILDYLIGFGLRESEAKVYLDCLKGNKTVSQISKGTGIQRTFVYDLIGSLLEKGLLSSLEVRGVKNFNAISIGQFKKLQEDKIKKFESILPEIKAIERLSGDRPKISLFEGREGLVTAQYDTLKAKGEILAYAASSGLYYEEPDFAKNYIRERVKRDIHVRAICPDSSELRPYIERDAKELRQSRIVPFDHFPFTNEIDIYGNKVAIMSYSGELLAVIIESESIAKTQRMIFELAWEGAEKYNKMTGIKRRLLQ